MTTLREAMAFLLYVGAARAAATPAQREALRARMPAALEVYRNTGSEGPVRAAIRDVLGATWAPDPHWQRYVDHVQREGSRAQPRQAPRQEAAQGGGRGHQDPEGSATDPEAHRTAEAPGEEGR